MPPATLDVATFGLDPALDPNRLHAVFARAGRIHLPGLLRREGADALHRHLSQETAWSLVLNDDAGVREATPELRRNYSTEQPLIDFAYGRAGGQFQFLYECRKLPDEATNRAADPSLLARFADFLNSPAFLDFARRVTGAHDIAWADVQATRYGRGHFLTEHNDSSEGQNRRIAYVYNLTPRWKVEWGGLLQFIDEDGHVAEAYTPRYNALNLFRVPQPHCVSIVAPFAPEARYSVTGWLRAR